MADHEAGTITTEQAVMLLMLDKTSQLHALEEAGAFRPIVRDRYWIKEVVQGYIKHLREHQFDTDTNTLASCWGMTASRISGLCNAGWFKPLPGKYRGKYNWIEACGGYIKFLRDEDRRSSKSAADSRIKDAKARDIETRTQQRLGRLIPLDVYEEMIDNITGIVRTEFAGLAAASTRDLTMRQSFSGK